MRGGPVADDAAWLRAMLAAESALARALEQAGLAAPGAGSAVTAAAARPGDLDIAELRPSSALTGNPVPGLARALTRLVPDPAAKAAVHKGATSQDIMDTAAMLLARDAIDAAVDSLSGAAAAVARLADAHRGSLMIGRTLLQQAVPVTFGVVAAGWLAGVDGALDGLASARQAPPAGPVGRGGAAVATLGCARQAGGLLATLVASAEQEHQRAAGAWHAEWQPFSHLLELAVSAAAWGRDLLENLTVDTARMAGNLAAAGGLPMAERVTTLLRDSLGAPQAHDLVATAAARAASSGVPLRDVLLATPDVADRLTQAGISAAEIEQALNPAGYLGASDAFVAAALAAHYAR